MDKFAFIIIFLSGLAFNALADGKPAGDNKEESLVSAFRQAKSSDARTKALKEASDYFLSINRIDKAVDSYRSTINDANISRKDKYLYYMDVGDIYLNVKRYTKATEYYQEAINVQKKAEDARLKLAGVYEMTDLNELAKQAYIDDLKYNNRSFDATLGLASLYLKLGLSTQAMEYYRRALTIKPDPEVYRNTARCAEMAGNKTIAIAICRQIPVEQRTYDDHITLGRLYAKDNKFKEAEESFSRAIKTDTGKIEGYIYLAQLYLDNNKPEPAEKLLQIALEKAPDEGAIHFFLGCAYFSQKQPGLALAEMKKAGDLSKSEVLKLYSVKFQDFLSNRAR